MSTASTTNVGIRLTLDGVQQVESGLNRVGSQAMSAAKAMAGIAGGVFSAAAFAGWIKGAIDAADQVDELSQKTGLLAEQVSGLKLLFDQEGMGDQFATVMARLSKEAAGGNEAFKAMGITLTGADGRLKSTREILGEVADKFAGYADGAEKAALAQAIFGKSGAELIPLLNGGSKSMDEMDEKARRMGLTLSGEAAAAAGKFNDNLFVLKANANAASVSIANALLPSLVDLSDALVTASKHGTGLMDTLRLIGTTTYSVNGFDLAKDMRSAREEIEDLTKARERYLKSSADTSGIDQALAGQIRRLEYLKDLQRQAVRPMPSDQSDAEAQRLGIKTMIQAAPVLETDTKNSRNNAAAKRSMSEAEKAAAEAIKARIAAQVSANAAFDEEFARIEEARLAGESRIRTAREMLQSIERETLLMGMSNAERERSIALWELERAGVVAGTEAYDAYAAKIGSAIDARNARAQAMETEQAAAKAAADQWQKTSDRIEDSLTDALMRGFENGKSFGENLGDSVANYFKTSVAEAIASAITKSIMSAIASQQWGQLLSGVFGGAGGNGIGSTIMQTALQRYFGGGGGGGAGAGSAISSYLVASKYGTAYGSQQTAALAAQESGMTTASGGWASYAGYAALIAAAAMIASNLYDKGWNEASAGRGRGQMYGFGNTKFQTDPSYSSSAALDYSAGRFNYDLVKKLGVISDKWNFIASSYQGFAVAFGRKLGAYGYEVDIANGDAETSGFARYKGGLLRSNKTVAIDIDQRDAAVVSQYFESVLEGSKNMARAMGYSTEAIDNYTGSLKVNMKGADSAAEQSERMAKAMDDLEYSLLKAASGGKYTREEFDKMMEGINQSIQSAGISAEGLTDIMVQGLLNNQSGEQIGAALSQMILGGVVQTFAQNAFAPVSQAIMSQIVQPMFVAMAAGIPAAQAVSAASIKGVIEVTKQSVQALKAIFESGWMQELFASLNAAFAEMGGAIGSIGIPNIGMPKIPTPKPIDNTKSERERLERELLNLQGNTTELRRRELMDLAPSNRALQERIWALEDERAILDERKTLEQQLLELQGNTTELRRREREELDASNRALYDQVKALEDVKKLQDEWKGLTDTIKEEIDRIRAYAMGQSSASQALSFVQGQYTIATAQARALDQEAAGKLPDLASQLAEMYEGAAGSASEYQQMVNSLLSSLEETNRITKDAAGLNDADVQKVQDEELAKKIALLQSSIDALSAQMGENATATKSVSSVLTRVTNNGNAMRTTTA